MIRFEWDEAKREANLRKHGVDFRDVPEVFAGETVTEPDTRFDYEESRFNTIGFLEGRPVIVSHTEEGSTYRIISARKLTKKEEQTYLGH